MAAEVSPGSDALPTAQAAAAAIATSRDDASPPHTATPHEASPVLRRAASEKTLTAREVFDVLQTEVNTMDRFEDERQADERAFRDWTLGATKAVRSRWDGMVATLNVLVLNIQCEIEAESAYIKALAGAPGVETISPADLGSMGRTMAILSFTREQRVLAHTAHVAFLKETVLPKLNTLVKSLIEDTTYSAKLMMSLMPQLNNDMKLVQEAFDLYRQSLIFTCSSFSAESLGLKRPACNLDPYVLERVYGRAVAAALTSREDVRHSMTIIHTDTLKLDQRRVTTVQAILTEYIRSGTAALKKQQDLLASLQDSCNGLDYTQDGREFSATIAVPRSQHVNVEAALPTPLASQVVREGTLLRQGGLLSTWREHHVVLSRLGFLHISAHGAAPAGPRRTPDPGDGVDVTQYTASVAVDPSLARDRHALELTERAQFVGYFRSAKVVRLAAPSMEEMVAWISAIKAVQDMLPPS